MQTYLSGLADLDLSHESRDKIRDVLSSILGSAMKFGFLVKNPVEGLRLPPPKKGKRSKPYVTPVLFAALLALIAEPYATMIFVAVYTGLRVSELIGLRWHNVHENSITIDERYCRGDWGAPKSEASNATIPVLPKVIERIQRLKSLTVDVRAGAGGSEISGREVRLRRFRRDRRKSATPRRSLRLGGFNLKSHHRPYSASRSEKSSNRINLLMNVNGMRPIGPFRCFAMISSARPRRSSRSGL